MSEAGSGVGRRASGEVEVPSPTSGVRRPTVLDAHGVTKQFGGLVAVNSVDLEISERSISSLIGPNGAGKTTFFNIVAGLYKPTDGQLLYRGRSIVGLNPNEITKLGIARTFQNIRLFSAMSALDNVLVGMHCRLTASALGAVLRTPGVMREERQQAGGCQGACYAAQPTAAGRADCGHESPGDARTHSTD